MNYLCGWALFKFYWVFEPSCSKVFTSVKLNLISLVKWISFAQAIICEKKPTSIIYYQTISFKSLLLPHFFLAGGKEDEHLSSICSAVRQVVLYDYTAVHLASSAYGVKLQIHLWEHQLQANHWAAESFLQTLPWGHAPCLRSICCPAQGGCGDAKVQHEGRSENCSVLYRVCGGQVKALKKRWEDGKTCVLTSCP